MVKSPMWQYTDQYLKQHAVTPVPVKENATAGTQYAAIRQSGLTDYYDNKPKGNEVNTVRPRTVVSIPGKLTGAQEVAQTGAGTMLNKNSTGAGTGGGGGGSTVNNSPYIDQLNALYDQIMNRKPFQYDLNGDLLYRQMADQYTQLGQQASRDAMGTAAGLTGGYGNSYAQQVGNQAYQQYLTALHQNIPELYDRAYEQYLNEGNELLQRYELAALHPNQLQALQPQQAAMTAETGEQDAYYQALQAVLGANLAPATSGTAAAYSLANYLKMVEDEMNK